MSLQSGAVRVCMRAEEDGSEAADESVDDVDNPSGHSEPAWMKE